jgi:hypothetical protein
VSRVHVLKCWPEPFAAILRNDKRYEIRRDDRGFAVGDILHLKEWDPHNGRIVEYSGFTGRELDAKVTYITHGGQWGLPPGVCVMALSIGGVKEQP